MRDTLVHLEAEEYIEVYKMALRQQLTAEIEEAEAKILDTHNSVIFSDEHKDKTVAQQTQRIAQLRSEIAGYDRQVDQKGN